MERGTPPIVVWHLPAGVAAVYPSEHMPKTTTAVVHYRAGRPAQTSTPYLKLAVLCLLLAGLMYLCQDQGPALLRSWGLM